MKYLKRVQELKGIHLKELTDATELLELTGETDSKIILTAEGFTVNFEQRTLLSGDFAVFNDNMQIVNTLNPTELKEYKFYNKRKK